MKWFVVWGPSLQVHPKWLKLTMEQRGAWVSIMAFGSGMEPPRFTFRDRDHVAMLLRRDRAEGADELVEALINGRWLDELETGQVVVHDHEDWQRYPSDMPDQRAERGRRSRSGHGDGHDPSRAVTGDSELSRQEDTEDTQALEDPDARSGIAGDAVVGTTPSLSFHELMTQADYRP